ncbi:MAG: ABC transporter permease subunit [Alkaliphilus sp.]
MFNIFLHEFRRNRLSLILWSVSMISLLALMMAIFPAIAEDREGLITTMKALMPEQLMEAFGLTRIDITSVLGFYTMDPYLTVVLFGSIYAFMLGAGILLKEGKDKTIEFLLSKPIKRHEIITSKLLVFFSNITIFNISIGISLVILFEIFADGDYAFDVFIFLLLGPLFVHILFGVLGFLFVALKKKHTSVLAPGLGLIMVTFFFNTISNAAERFEFLKYVSPFEYVDPTDILIYEKLNANYMILIIILVAISIGGTYYFYQKKDILL